MKCSLLTLSTFIDRELPVERSAEVDAHLVGCPRCSSGVRTLREEKLRVAQLARVRVPAPSAAALLESIGVSSSNVPQRSTRPVPPTSVAPPTRPWLDGRSSAALPWTPLRPGSPASPTEEITVPIVPADVQPDLPFDAPAAEEESSELIMGSGSAMVEWEADDAPAVWEPDIVEQQVAHDAWELQVPGYAGQERGSRPATPVPPVAAIVEQPAVIPPPAPPAPPATAPPPTPAQPWAPATADVATRDTSLIAATEAGRAAGPPQRAAADGPVRGLWNRARDAVGVRMTLAGAEAPLEDTVEIVTGPAPQRRSLPPPIAGFGAPSPAAMPSTPPPSGDVGAVRVTPRPSPATAPPVEAAQTIPTRQAPSDIDRSFDWNAFGGSGYADVPPAPRTAPPRPAERDRRPLGRHTRAVHERPAGGLQAALAGAVATARRRGSALGGHARQAAGGLPSVSPQRRVLMIAGAVLALLVVVLLGRSLLSRPSTPAVSQVRPSTVATTAPRGSAVPSLPPATAPPSVAPALVSPLTFGSGATGFDLARVRYGAVGGAQRIVFDLTSANAAATAGPTVVVGLTNPTTLLVTFSGIGTAGSLAAPPAGGLVQTLTPTSAGGGRTVYKLILAHAATPSGFYLTGPLRFVLDVR